MSPSYYEKPTRTPQAAAPQSVHNTHVLTTGSIDAHAVNAHMVNAQTMNTHNFHSQGNTDKLEKEVAELRIEVRELREFLEHNLKSMMQMQGRITRRDYQSVDTIEEKKKKAALRKESEGRAKKESGETTATEKPAKARGFRNFFRSLG